MKLYPDLIRQLSRDLDEIAIRYGGRPIGRHLYSFQTGLSGAAHNTAEASYAMYAFLQKERKNLYGTTVLIGRKTEKNNDIETDKMNLMALRIVDAGGLWLTSESKEDFNAYFQFARCEELYRIESLKSSNSRIEACLPKLLVRLDYIDAVTRTLTDIGSDGNDTKIFVLRGTHGSGKRRTLKNAMKILYSEDAGAPVIIPFTTDHDNPLEPIARALTGADISIMDTLETHDAHWWNSGGKEYFEDIQTGKIWTTAGDQISADMKHSLYIYVKQLANQRHRCGLPTYVVLDGYYPGSEAMALLLPMLTELLDIDGIRIIMIRDSADFTETCPLPGEWDEIEVRHPPPKEWIQILSDASIVDIPEDESFEDDLLRCDGNIYLLFHFLLVRSARGVSVSNPDRTITASLETESRKILFLIHAAAGLLDRSLLIAADPDDPHSKLQHCDELIAYGLVREEPDGKLFGYPGCPTSAFTEYEGFQNDAKRFGEYIYRRYEAGAMLEPFRLIRYLSVWGPKNHAVTLLENLLECLLVQRQLTMAKKLLKDLPSLFPDTENPESQRLQGIENTMKLRYKLLTGDRNRIRIETRVYSSDMPYAQFAYVQGHWTEAAQFAKKALFSFQQAGNHRGATSAHIELALALLALNNVRDALEHFDIAHRIGYQINFTWGILRAITMRTVTLFLLGNLSGCLCECEENRKIAEKSGRRDLWMLLTLTALRIAWELGRFKDAVALAEEGRRTAEFYGLIAEQRVMSIWKGRCLLSMQDEEGTIILESFSAQREAIAFLAEQAWIDGDIEEAKKLINHATRMKRRTVRLQGEDNDWSDGYFPIEGRLADSAGPFDVLGERIQGLKAFMEARTGDIKAVDRLNPLLERDGRHIPRPFSHHYALWASMAMTQEDDVAEVRYMSRAFNDLQIKAGRFDDNQIKHAWLTKNYWNKTLMEEAHRLSFL